MDKWYSRQCTRYQPDIWIINPNNSNINCLIFLSALRLDNNELKDINGLVSSQKNLKWLNVSTNQIQVGRQKLILNHISTSFSILVVRSCVHPQIAGVAGYSQQQDRQDWQLLLPQWWLQPPNIRRQFQQHRRDPRHDSPARVEEHLPQQQPDQPDCRGELQVSDKPDQGGATEQQSCDAR